MARIISKRSKKRKGGKKAVKVITKTRRVYVAAKRKGRKVRRALGASVNKKDIVLAVAGAGVGSIGSAYVLAKIPDTLPGGAVTKNAIVAAAGGAIAYYGIKKRNKAVMGAGLGMAAVGAKGIIGTAVPTLAGVPRYNVLSAPIARTTPRLNAPYIKVNAPTMGTPFVKTPVFSDEESI